MIRVLSRLVIFCMAYSMMLNFAHAETTEELAVYCEQSGGAVIKMPAIYNTLTGAVTGFTKRFCHFTVNNGLIAIGLSTFASDKPNIAATYMKKLGEIQADSPLLKGVSSNPSHNVCKNLGGAIIGFVTNGAFTDAQGMSDICVFGDGSMVSGWSLIYMANHRDGYDKVKEAVKSEPLNIEWVQ